MVWLICIFSVFSPCVMIWTVFHRPRLLPQAVTLMIFGHHFRKVAEMNVFTRD